MKKIRMLPILAFFVLTGLTFTACYLGGRYARPQERTLETPEIFFRRNTADGELGWFGGRSNHILLRATANGVTREIDIYLSQGQSQLNLAAMEELRTADFYEISMMLRGFDQGREDRTDGRPHHIFHDSGWSNTIIFRRIISSPTPRNLRLVGGGTSTFEVAFEVEPIGGLNTVVQLSIEDSNGNVVSTLERRLMRHDDNTVTTMSISGAMLNEYYTITAKARYDEWNSSHVEQNFGQGRTKAAEAAQSQPLTVIRRQFDFPTVTQATMSSVTWDAVEGVENYTVSVFRRNASLVTLLPINTTISDTEFDFEAYVEGRGLDWLGWNSWSDSSGDFFLFVIRPRQGGTGGIVIGNTLYIEPPSVSINDVTTNPNVHRLYLPPPGTP